MVATFRHKESTTNMSHKRSTIYRMYCCRWRIEIMSDVAKSMAPKKRVNMAPMQAVTIATTTTTVLITVATTMETITVITSTDIPVTSTVAIIDLWEYIGNTSICLINISERIALLVYMSNRGQASYTGTSQLNLTRYCIQHRNDKE